MPAPHQTLFSADQAACPANRNEQTSDGDNRYTVKTLIAKWFEERCGLDEIRTRKPLPTQYEHAYRTIYGDSYNKPEIRQGVFEREGHAYPGHQPELNLPRVKAIPKSRYTLDYVDPALLMNPPSSSENQQFQYCGPPAPSDADKNAEKYELCGSYIPLRPCSLTDSAAMKNRQPVLPGFCGYYIPTKGPLGQCTAEYCEHCLPTAAPSGPGPAACCGPSIP